MHLPPHLFAQLPPIHPAEERAKIILSDFILNHRNRNYDAAFIRDTIDQWLAVGHALFCADKVMFTLEEQAPGVAEFHSINGGSARDLTAGVNKLLRFLAPTYQFAVTYYDNPRVSDLLKHADYAADCRKLNEGEDRTFEAKFNLRS